MAKPDRDAVLRRLPLAVGMLGGSLLLVNRLSAPVLTEAQARSDALGVLLSALLILTGMLWQRVQPRLPDTVMLEGEEGLQWAESLAEPLKLELAWASHTLLTNTVTRSLVVWYDGQTLLRRGVLGAKAAVEPGPILSRSLSTGKPVYLVALKVYPGRIEFDYLPPNTQGVIVQPLGARGALILGANAPRSYTRQDEAWVAAIAAKLNEALER